LTAKQHVPGIFMVLTLLWALRLLTWLTPEPLNALKARVGME
jgi:hypothetical protein